MKKNEVENPVVWLKRSWVGPKKLRLILIVARTGPDSVSVTSSALSSFQLLAGVADIPGIPVLGMILEQLDQVAYSSLANHLTAYRLVEQAYHAASLLIDFDFQIAIFEGRVGRDKLACFPCIVSVPYQREHFETGRRDIGSIENQFAGIVFLVVLTVYHLAGDRITNPDRLLSFRRSLPHNP